MWIRTMGTVVNFEGCTGFGIMLDSGTLKTIGIRALYPDRHGPEEYVWMGEDEKTAEALLDALAGWIGQGEGREPVFSVPAFLKGHEAEQVTDVYVEDGFLVTVKEPAKNRGKAANIHKEVK